MRLSLHQRLSRSRSRSRALSLTFAISPLVVASLTAGWDSAPPLLPATPTTPATADGNANRSAGAAPNASAKLEVLHRLKDVVLGTAAFIADFPERRVGTGTNGKYLDLGPPLVSASEGEGPYDVWNPTYELTQFNFSLDVANSWLARLGRPRNAAWEEVRANLAPLPVVTMSDGTRVYNRHQHCLPNVFEPFVCPFSFFLPRTVSDKILS